jgi:uncharacterized protein DUF4398
LSSLGLLAAGAAFGVGACALQPAYVAPLARAHAAIGAARDAGAAQLASPQYRLAGEKLALSERFIAVYDAKPARWLAEQAEVDAELARMKAISAYARAERTRQAEALRRERRAATEGTAR